MVSEDVNTSYAPAASRSFVSHVMVLRMLGTGGNVEPLTNSANHKIIEDTHMASQTQVGTFCCAYCRRYAESRGFMFFHVCTV